MTTQVKYLLKEAVFLYRSATESVREDYRNSIIKNLDDHEKAMHYIGMGLSSDHVKAALIFKRIFKF